MSKSKKRLDRGRRIASPPETPEIAASLARIGWPVFPVTIYEDPAGKRHKVPAVKWKAEATADVDTVLRWFTGEHSGRWIGVYAGAAGIVTLDLDPAKPRIDRETGKKIGVTRSGVESLERAKLVAPKTFNYPTHRKGGRHHVYAAPLGVELTIGADIFGPDGERLEGVDVRSGAGLMIYYGPELTEAPALAPAPEWLLVPKDRARGGDAHDRAPSADEDAYRARLVPGKPDPEVAAALAAVKADGMTHDDMLESITELVSLGVRGHRGVGEALDEARERYSTGWPDADRHWDNAVTGSIKRLGLPPTTLELSKPERKEIRRRNDPDEIKRRKDEKTAVRRVERHERALAKVKDPKADAPLPGDRVLEDATLAAELASVLEKQWAYSRGLGLMRWSGKVWRPAEEHSLIEAVRKKLAKIEVEEHKAAALRGDLKAIDKARSLFHRSKIVAVARLVIGILAEHEPAFDAHPDLLNVPNGVVDLRTGELMKHDHRLYLTTIAAAEYDPNADMRLWNKALEAVSPPVAAWLKIRFGQAATGYTPEDDTLVIFSGAGENGKTGLMIGTRRALGDYAKTLPERLLLADPGDHPTTLMTLMGARLGVIEELPEGRALNVKRLKDVVGTPEITARKMRQDDVTFTATHGIMLSTNYLPIVAETDHGTWRRLALVRFRSSYLKPGDYRKLKKAGRLTKHHKLGDPEIKRHFEHANDPGALRWIVEGAREWYAAGMRFPDRPKRVERDTERWRMEADPILAYAAERLSRDEGFGISAADLSDDFNAWLERRGHRRWTQQTINSRFDGHVSFDGVSRKSVKWSSAMRPSRPSSAFATRKLPGVTTAWRGVRFRDEQVLPSEAELDAATLADLERRATS